jgi:hypothetical protein
MVSKKTKFFKKPGFFRFLTKKTRFFIERIEKKTRFFSENRIFSTKTPKKPDPEDHNRVFNPPVGCETQSEQGPI